MSKNRRDLKAQMIKKRRKQESDDEIEAEYKKFEQELAKQEKELKNQSEEAPKKNKRFKKVSSASSLVCARKGISSNLRFFMKEFFKFMPNIQQAPKFGGSDRVELNAVADKSGCETIMLFETVSDSPYLWISIAQEGPTVCFRMLTMHTCEDVNGYGICTKFASPILVFDSHFDEKPEYGICKELLTRALRVPYGTKKMKEHVDTVLSFFILENHIYFRRYQIDYQEPIKLFEAGPQFCLEPISILGGSFCGQKIWQNPQILAQVKAFQAKEQNKQKQAAKNQQK